MVITVGRMDGQIVGILRELIVVWFVKDVCVRGTSFRNTETRNFFYFF
jgi:hypothetical protein